MPTYEELISLSRRELLTDCKRKIAGNGNKPELIRAILEFEDCQNEIQVEAEINDENSKISQNNLSKEVKFTLKDVENLLEKISVDKNENIVKLIGIIYKNLYGKQLLERSGNLYGKQLLKGSARQFVTSEAIKLNNINK